MAEHKKEANAVKGWMSNKTALKIGIAALVLIIAVIFLETRDAAKDEKSVKSESMEVIVLKPGKTISLEINNKEWSPWIDASKKGLYSYAHAPKGITFMFRNGETVTIGDGEKDKIFPNSSQYLVYKLKSPEGSQLAIIEASNESIIE